MSRDKVTIYDVAERLGLSTATINRVINNKPNVNEKTRKRVLETIEEMGYRPSKIAAGLSRLTIHISVLIAASIADFHNEIERGAIQALDDLYDFNVRGKVRIIEKMPTADKFIDAMKEEAENGADAIALVGHKDEAAVVKAMQEISKKGVKFCFGVSKLNLDCNIFSVKSNGYIAGKMAAELLENMLCEGKTAIIVGYRGTNVHDDCCAGFTEYIKNSRLTFADCYESFDEYEAGKKLADVIFDEHPDIKGVYISTANSVGFCKRVEEMKKGGDIRIITSDIFPALLPFMERHTVDASIFQNPYLTGELLVKCMYENMTEGGKYAGEVIYTDPQVVLGSNKELFLKHIK